MADLTPDTIDRLRYARSILVAEIAHHAQKRWAIFSWASGVLAASIAVGALRAERLFPGQAVAIAFAVAVVCGYAFYWLRMKGDDIDDAVAQIRTIDEQLGTFEGILDRRSSSPSSIQSDPHGTSYAVAVISLAIISVLLLVSSAWWPEPV